MYERWIKITHILFIWHNIIDNAFFITIKIWCMGSDIDNLRYSHNGTMMLRGNPLTWQTKHLMIIKNMDGVCLEIPTIINIILNCMMGVGVEMTPGILDWHGQYASYHYLLEYLSSMGGNLNSFRVKCVMNVVVMTPLPPCTCLTNCPETSWCLSLWSWWRNIVYGFQHDLQMV